MQTLTPDWEEVCDVLLLTLNETVDYVVTSLKDGAAPMAVANTAIADLQDFINAASQELTREAV